jgi:hypothetical protein
MDDTGQKRKCLSEANKQEAGHQCRKRNASGHQLKPAGPGMQLASACFRLGCGEKPVGCGDITTFRKPNDIFGQS